MGLSGGLADNGGGAPASVLNVISSAVYVAAPSGVAATDTTNLQNAINQATPTGAAPFVIGGARVVPAQGTYITTGLTAKSLVHVDGPGEDSCQIKLADGANTDVIKGANYDTLTGTNSNAGIFGFKITGVTINGNAANNSSGRGMALYGYANRFDCRVTNTVGLGFVHEWGNTGAVNSDTLGIGHMECEGRVYVDRCLGGGIDWLGPSDSRMEGHIAKCGPSSSSTTIGLRIRSNAVASRFRFHIWGSQHDVGASLEASGTCDTMLEVEGAATSQCDVKASGQAFELRAFPSGGSNIGLRIGPGGGTPGDHRITGHFSQCGINFVSDGGNSRYGVTCYWPDSTKQFVTGTAQANKPSIMDLDLTGDSDTAIAYDGFTAIPSGGALVTGLIRRTANRIYADSRAASVAHLASGYKGQTAARLECANSLSISGAQLTSGTLVASGPIWLPPQDPISTITLFSTVAGANLDHLWCCLLGLTGWNGSTGTWAVLAKTGDTAGDHAAWTVDTHRNFAVATDGAGTAMTTYVAPIAGINVWVGVMAQGASSPALGLMGIPTSVGLKAAANEVEAISINGPGSLTTPASLTTPLSTSSVTSKVLCFKVK